MAELVSSDKRLGEASPLTLNSDSTPGGVKWWSRMAIKGLQFGRAIMGAREGDDDAIAVEVVDIGPSVKVIAVSLMEAAIDSLSHELSKLRTGRASAGMLDHIIVETGGVKMPLSRLAVVSVIDSKTLSVTPYDPDALKELESAIVSSPLGLNPKADGNRLIAPIPP
ncbi:ribosome recycling factor [Actinidia rufa]|uniref:Ribosome-recycling factor, chloroplastic n=1 Tax=Actinidia rufa TaxID=165716 RepID=A0A7J0EAE8_9ERIC|nr:ribosome recycling factor [Actinidia rufa]